MAVEGVAGGDEKVMPCSVMGAGWQNKVWSG